MFSERLNRLIPYVPGEQPKDQQYLKLNTNENPFPPPQAVADFIQKFDYERLRLYPDPTFDKLRRKMSEVYGVRPGQVFICNGSDEGLSFCFYTFFDKKRGRVLFPRHTYSFYPVYCDFYELEYRRIPLAPDFSIDIAPYLAQKPSTGIIFPNPNAPTGVLLGLDRIEALLKDYPDDRVVIIDEAYIDFGGRSALELLVKYKNLVIVRTFSKAFSMAGLRLGYVFAGEPLIDALFKVKDSFNSYPVNMFAQDLACTALDNIGAFRANNIRIMENRDWLTEKLMELGWETLPSAANFIFTRKPGCRGRDIYTGLKERGILVRHFQLPGIEDFLRITVGRKDDMDVLLVELKDF